MSEQRNGKGNQRAVDLDDPAGKVLRTVERQGIVMKRQQFQWELSQLFTRAVQM